jgi:glutaredoxin
VRRPKVTMYSRHRCGLCDHAREVILALLRERDFEFEEIFVDGDDVLERAYGLRVPVVLVNGAEEFETQVEPALLREALGPAPSPGD